MINNNSYAEKLKKKREEQEKKLLEQKEKRLKRVHESHAKGQKEFNSKEDNTRFTEVVSKVEETSGKEPNKKLKESIKQFVEEEKAIVEEINKKEEIVNSLASDALASYKDEEELDEEIDNEIDNKTDEDIEEEDDNIDERDDELNDDDDPYVYSRRSGSGIMQFFIGAIGLGIVLMVGFLVIGQVQESLPMEDLEPTIGGNISAGLDSTASTVMAGFGLIAVGIIVFTAFGLINIFRY